VNARPARLTRCVSSQPSPASPSGRAPGPVVDAALDGGVERLVQELVSLLYPDRGGVWIDEHVPPDPLPIARGNLAAEANAERFTAAGGIGVVLRFGWFYGPGARHSEQILALARRHVVFVLGAPDGYLSSIHVADGGEAVAASMYVDAGVYNVVDDEPVTKRLRGAAGGCWCPPVAAGAWPPWHALRRSAHLADPTAPSEQRPPHQQRGQAAAISRRARGLGGHGGRLRPAAQNSRPARYPTLTRPGPAAAARRGATGGGGA
jgi:hypothetical protein